jgi:hypothetical protein
MDTKVLITVASGCGGYLAIVLSQRGDKEQTSSFLFGCGITIIYYISTSEFGVLLAADRQSTSSSGYRASLWDP